MVSNITKFIKYVCVQDAVYWAPLGLDGYGSMRYEQPRTIKCRWTDTTKTIMDNNGSLIVCKAEILVTEDLEVNGMLYLGDLDQLTEEQKNNPLLLDEAYTIKRVDRVPLFRSTDEFVRTVYL